LLVATANRNTDTAYPHSLLPTIASATLARRRCYVPWRQANWRRRKA